MLLDKAAVEKLFTMFRQNIHDQIIRIDTIEPAMKNTSPYNFILAQSKSTFLDMTNIMDLMEAMALNSIEQRESISLVSDAFLKTDDVKDILIKNLQAKVEEQDKEIIEFKKHEGFPNRLENYFKRSSETTST